ncbi:MAG: helix-turn-helix domain-containing protein [Rikenellaceae bacterium]
MDNQHITDKYFFNGEEYYCSLALAIDLIGGKWKSIVIYHLKDGAMRSNELQRTLKGVTNRMFTLAVRELEETGLVERVVYPVVPPHVEYKLTSRGESVLPIILQLAKWGIEISE